LATLVVRHSLVVVLLNDVGVTRWCHASVVWTTYPFSRKSTTVSVGRLSVALCTRHTS